MNKDNDFQLDLFLKDNHQLFTIMGIFGAISIYLNTLSQGSDIQSLRVGIVSSFVLFIVVSLVIFLKAFKTHDDESVPLAFLTPSKGNFKRILFIIPFSLLIITITTFLINAYPEPSNAIFGFFLYILGMPVFFGIISFIRNKSAKIFLITLFILMIASSIGFYYMVKYNLTIFALFFSSLSTGSAIGLMITSLDYIYEKYKATIGKVLNE